MMDTVEEKKEGAEAPFEKGRLLDKMILIASVRHAGQLDKGGNPYILHPLKVMHYLKTEDEELMCIAVGHDLIEDTFDSIEEGTEALLFLGFTKRIVEGIRSLTKIPGESYEEYKQKVKGNPDAIRVKMADLRHNSDIRRLKGITQKDIDRISRYHSFYLELRDAL